MTVTANRETHGFQSAYYQPHMNITKNTYYLLL
jgi:hypothetical protein